MSIQTLIGLLRRKPPVGGPASPQEAPQAPAPSADEATMPDAKEAPHD